MYKVIFLDVDGVLNNTSTGRDDLSRQCLHLLKDIVDNTGAKLVLTSDWRLYASRAWLVDVLSGYNLDLLDDTVDLISTADGARHDEIRDWLSKNDVSDFVILDDNKDAGLGFDGHLHQTSISLGLTLEVAKAVIGHFNRCVWDDGWSIPIR